MSATEKLSLVGLPEYPPTAVCLIEANSFHRHNLFSMKMVRVARSVGLTMTILLAVSLSFLSNGAGLPTQSTSWARILGGPGFDQASTAIQTSDGGYVVAGYTTSFGVGADAWILKLDYLGRVDWQKAYGGRGADIPSFIQQTEDAGYVV